VSEAHASCSWPNEGRGLDAEDHDSAPSSSEDCVGESRFASSATKGCERCNVLQCVAVCCSVLQCVAVCCSVLRCVAVCCSTEFVSHDLLAERPSAVREKEGEGEGDSEKERVCMCVCVPA